MYSLLTSNFWKAQLLSQFGRPLPNPRRLSTMGRFYTSYLLLVGPESSVQHQKEKWLLQTTECSKGSMKSAIFTSTNFTNCRFKLASFWNICIVCPVLFQSVQNWTTQNFTIMKKLNVVKQTVSKKIMTRPANNGSGKDSFVSHAIIKRDFGGSTRDVTGKIAPFKMANVSNLEELLQIEIDFWKKKNE